MVQFIPSRPFPGWDEFRSRLASVRPDNALALVQSFVAHISDHNEGVFCGEAPVFPITLHVLVREWIRALGAGALPSSHPSSRDNCALVLFEGSLEVNGLRNEHPALGRLPNPLKDEARLRALWFHHLEQHSLNWAPKLELGRSQRMFAEIWPKLFEAGALKLRSGEATAFLSARYALLLALGIWHARGNVADVRALFRETDLSEVTLRTVLDAVAVPLEKIQADFSSAPLYPESICNYFQRYPVIRVGEWTVFAPLPNLLLQSWDLRNLFDSLEMSVANVGERGGAEFYRALGVVFEQYARELLKELADDSGMSFVPPFRYDGSRDSPDGFLAAGGTTLCFEMKCYRVPRAAYDRVELGSFETWFASLLGRNDKDRAPLTQGESFFEAWRAGTKEICAKLGPAPRKLRGWYFIVSYEDVPAFCSWNVFRKWYAEKHLDATVRALWANTIVVSVRDLETLVAAGREHRRRTSQPFDLPALLARYGEYRNKAPDVDQDPVKGFKDGLGAWLLRSMDQVLDSEPTVLEAARRRLFDDALRLGFPAPL